MRAARSDIPVSRASSLNDFIRWLERERIPHGRALERARIPRRPLPGTAILPVYSILQFVDSMAHRQDVHDLGVRAALHPGSSETASTPPSASTLRLATSENGLTLLAGVCELMKIHSSHVPTWVRETPTEVWLCMRGSTAPDHPGAVHAEQYRVVSVVALMRRLLGDSWRPHAVHLEDAGPVAPSLAEFLGASVIRTGMPYEAVRVSRARLEQPLAPSRPAPSLEADPEDAAVILSDLGAWTDRLSATMVQACGGGVPPLAYAAEVLGLGPRTLQRRLRRVGLTCSDLLERARVSEAQKLLRDPQIPIRVVAHRLGYGSSSAFGRAYRRRRGTSPSADRARTTTS